MTATPVRKPGGVLHLCRATGRGYRAACGATLSGGTLQVPKRADWARSWALERVCAKCERRRAQARSDRDLARLAGW